MNNYIVKVNLGQLNTVTIRTDNGKIKKGDYFKLNIYGKEFKFVVIAIEISSENNIALVTLMNQANKDFYLSQEQINTIKNEFKALLRETNSSTIFYSNRKVNQ